MMSKVKVMIAAVAALAMIGMIFAALPAAQDGVEDDQSLGATFSMLIDPDTGVRCGRPINVQCTLFTAADGNSFAITIDGAPVYYNTRDKDMQLATGLTREEIASGYVNILVPTLTAGNHTVRITGNGTNIAERQFSISTTGVSAISANKTTVDRGEEIVFTATNLTSLSTQVTWTITDPSGATSTRTSTTNSSGTATLTFATSTGAYYFGEWSVKATDTFGLNTPVRTFMVEPKISLDKTEVKTGEVVNVSASLSDHHGPVYIMLGSSVPFLADTGDTASSLTAAELGEGVDVIVPKLVPGVYTVSMYTQYGTSGQTLYTTTITVTEDTEVSVVPTTAEKGTTVTITGKNFANVPGKTFVLEIYDEDDNLIFGTGSLIMGSDGSFTFDFLIGKYDPAGDYSVYVVQADFYMSAVGTFTVTMPDLLLSKDSGKSSELLTVYSEEFEDDDGSITIKIAGQTVANGITAEVMAMGVAFCIPTLDVGVHDVEVSAGEKTFSRPFEVTHTTEISLSSDDIKVGDNIVILGVNFSRNDTTYHVGLYDSTNTGYIAGSEGKTGYTGTFTCLLQDIDYTGAGEYLIVVYDDEGYFVEDFYFNVREYVWMSPTESGGKSGEVITVISDYFSLYSEEGATMKILLIIPDGVGLVLFMPNGAKAEDLTAAQLMAGVDVIIPGWAVGDYFLAVVDSDDMNVSTPFAITESISVKTFLQTYKQGDNIGIISENFMNVKDMTVSVDICRLSDNELIASLNIKTLANGSFGDNGMYPNMTGEVGEYMITAADMYGNEASCVFELISASKTVTFTAVQAGGIKDVEDTTSIIITFSEPVTDLTNVGIIKGTGEVVAGALSGSGTTWTLAISSVVQGGNVTVNIHSFGVFNVMPAAAQSVTVEVFGDISYSVTVVTNTSNVSSSNVSGGGKYAPGATVNITASNTGNYAFVEWTTTSADVVFADKLSATTSFTMPEHAVTVTAVYGYVDTTGAVGNDEGGSGGMDTTIIIAVVAVVAIGGVGAAYFLFLRKP